MSYSANQENDIMTIQCVTIATNDHFQGNLIAQQHKLRHRSIIKRQNWEVPEIHGMEYDQYDNPATTYCVWSDEDGIARGVARLYPTDRPFMLQEHFGYMVEGELPRGSRILEGSRFCIDKNLPKEQRDRVAKELVLSYLEYAIDMNVESIIGIMYPIYWRNLFLKNDWEAKWLGEVKRTPEVSLVLCNHVIPGCFCRIFRIFNQNKCPGNENNQTKKKQVNGNQIDTAFPYVYRK